MWIESHQSLRDHPKLKRLCRYLDIDELTAIGLLHCLWWWSVDYATDGNLDAYESPDIAAGAHWTGNPTRLVESLTRAGFLELDRESESLVIHDWLQYAGHINERRVQNRLRQQRFRDRSKAAVAEAAVIIKSAHVAPDPANALLQGLPDRTGPDLPDLTGPDMSLSPVMTPQPESPRSLASSEGGKKKEFVTERRTATVIAPPPVSADPPPSESVDALHAALVALFYGAPFVMRPGPTWHEFYGIARELDDLGVPADQLPRLRDLIHARFPNYATVLPSNLPKYAHFLGAKPAPFVASTVDDTPHGPPADDQVVESHLVDIRGLLGILARSKAVPSPQVSVARKREEFLRQAGVWRGPPGDDVPETVAPAQGVAPSPVSPGRVGKIIPNPTVSIIGRSSDPPKGVGPPTQGRVGQRSQVAVGARL